MCSTYKPNTNGRFFLNEMEKDEKGKRKMFQLSIWWTAAEGNHLCCPPSGNTGVPHCNGKSSRLMVWRQSSYSNSVGQQCLTTLP